jgi:hypothetical protein
MSNSPARISMHAAEYTLTLSRPCRRSSQSIFHHSDRKSDQCWCENWTFYGRAAASVIASSASQQARSSSRCICPAWHPGPLGQRPVVLARQVTDRPGDMLASLAARPHLGKTACQAPHQLIQIPTDQPDLFCSGGSRLQTSSPQQANDHEVAILLRHTSRSGQGSRASSGHEARLPC